MRERPASGPRTPGLGRSKLWSMPGRWAQLRLHTTRPAASPHSSGSPHQRNHPEILRLSDLKTTPRLGCATYLVGWSRAVWQSLYRFSCEQWNGAQSEMRGPLAGWAPSMASKQRAAVERMLADL